MRLQYRTIKEPPDTGRVTLKQAEQAVRALQQEESLKSSRLRYRTIKDPAVQGRITVDQVVQALRALELERQAKSKLSQKNRRNGSNGAGKTAAKGIKSAKKA